MTQSRSVASSIRRAPMQEEERLRDTDEISDLRRKLDHPVCLSAVPNR